MCDYQIPQADEEDNLLNAVEYAGSEDEDTELNLGDSGYRTEQSEGCGPDDSANPARSIWNVEDEYQTPEQLTQAQRKLREEQESCRRSEKNSKN